MITVDFTFIIINLFNKREEWNCFIIFIEYRLRLSDKFLYNLSSQTSPWKIIFSLLLSDKYFRIWSMDIDILSIFG